MKTSTNCDAHLAESIFQTGFSAWDAEGIMVSVIIFCHDKREAAFFDKVCSQCIALIKKEHLKKFIISNEDSNMMDIVKLKYADLIIAEIAEVADLKQIRYIRSYFPQAGLLLVSTAQVLPEHYVVPEVSPDMLLLKPYTYSKACRIVHRMFSWFYRERYEDIKLKKLLEISITGELYYLNYADIYYLEARDKKIVLHTRRHEFSFYNSLRKLEKDLPQYFIRCHRSYIVNFMFIRKLDLMNGLFYLDKETVIPISQKYRVKLVELLQKYKDLEGK